MTAKKKENKEDKDQIPADDQQEPSQADAGSPEEPAEPEESSDEASSEEDVQAEIEDEKLAADSEEASLLDQKSSNVFLRRMMDSNFLEYASYVIKERAIPDVDDGLKPVQRRILWSLFRMDDGKFHKVANVIGHTMQYHPHGDASIGDALVVLANKEYYIDKQGNFGNILTGDAASAARYIECRLSPLARETLFNSAITEFSDSYDGRNKEPVVLPVKVPSLLMLGAEGIAVGMSTKILPHNFNELLNAQISYLRKEDFELYPDFLQGGIMDVSEYEEGNGKIKLRAKIDRDGRKLIIREVPATTTTESLIASIEKAVARSKIKLSSINDYTAENVEIEIVPMRGYDPEKCLKALYTYTDCSVSISTSLNVICDERPVQMTVTEVIKRNTDHLVEYLRRELEIELGKLEDAFHQKTLAQIFIENRIYKRIEECETNEEVFAEVHKGLKKFRHMLKRDVTDDDVERLLAIPIRRISLFDINKNRKDIDDIVAEIEQVQKNLKRIKAFTIKYLEELIEKYGALYPRRTEIETFIEIDRKAVALNNIKVGWDRKNCYIGTNVRSDETVTCNEYDHLLCVERSGNYKVINIPDKVFCGRLYDFRKYDKDQPFAVIYSEKKTGKWFVKRTVIDKFITDREYRIVPKGCRLELFTSRVNSIYECKVDSRYKDKQQVPVNLLEAPERSAKARGLLIASKPVKSMRFIELIEDALEDQEAETSDEAENDSTSVGGDAGNESTESSGSAEQADQQQGEEADESAKQEKAADKKKQDKEPDKPSPSKKTDAPSKSKSESKSSKKDDDSELELESDDDDQGKDTPAKKPAKKKASTKKEPAAAPPSKPDDDEEDLGITQPEFGF